MIMNCPFNPMPALAGILLCCTLVSGCSHPAAQPGSSYAHIPREIATPPIDLSVYQPPSLPGYELQGDAIMDTSATRKFVYRSTDDDNISLVLSIYPIPGGWEDMPPIRLIGGHFGQLLEAAINRMLRIGQENIQVAEEQLLVRDALANPIAWSRLSQPRGNQLVIQELTLTASLPLYLAMELNRTSSPPIPEVDPQALAALLETATLQIFASGS